MAPSKKKRKIQPPPVIICPFTSTLKADPNKLSLLLDLPAELRTDIYQLIINSYGPLTLSRRTSHRELGYPFSALTRVNKQVHQEFTSAAFLLADIHTECMHYDFRHIVAFLNRLDEDDIHALPSIASTRAGRKITVVLYPNKWKGEEPAFLQRWLNRAAHPSKKGTSVRFEYLLEPSYRVMVQWPGRQPYPPWSEPSLAKWVTEAEAMPPGRKREEFERIIAAVR